MEDPDVVPVAGKIWDDWVLWGLPGAVEAVVVGRSSESSDAAVKNALVEAGRSLRDIKALDVVSVGLRGDDMDEWGALVRISFLVQDTND